MRHKYDTRAIVLARSPLGEANASLALLTRDVGLVRARAQGLRKSGAKLAGSLPTFAESEVVLMRGAEGWRLSGALLAENWFSKIPHTEHPRAARICSLLLRLVSGEAADERLFDILHDFFAAISAESVNGDAAEILAALNILAALGLDAGELPKDHTELGQARGTYVARVNRGIAASGLY